MEGNPEYDELMRTIVYRTPKRLRHLRGDDAECVAAVVSGLSNEEVATIGEHLPGIVGEGLGEAEDPFIKFLKTVDHEEDRFHLLQSAINAILGASCRQRAARAIMPDLRRMSDLMADEEVRDLEWETGVNEEVRDLEWEAGIRR